MLKELLIEATPISLLAKGLDAYGMRLRTIASNIANAETPGYVRKMVVFEEYLKSWLKGQSLRGESPSPQSPYREISQKIQPKVIPDFRPGEAHDLNNVNIDHEMALLAQNHLQFLIAARLAKHYFEMLNLSLKGA